MRVASVTLSHEAFAAELVVYGTLLQADPDVGFFTASFELERVEDGRVGIDLTPYLSERLLNELADDAFEILTEQAR